MGCSVNVKVDFAAAVEVCCCDVQLLSARSEQCTYYRALTDAVNIINITNIGSNTTAMLVTISYELCLVTNYELIDVLTQGLLLSVAVGVGF